MQVSKRGNHRRTRSTLPEDFSLIVSSLMLPLKQLDEENKIDIDLGSMAGGAQTLGENLIANKKPPVQSFVGGCLKDIFNLEYVVLEVDGENDYPEIQVTEICTEEDEGTTISSQSDHNREYQPTAAPMKYAQSKAKQNQNQDFNDLDDVIIVKTSEAQPQLINMSQDQRLASGGEEIGQSGHDRINSYHIAIQSAIDYENQTKLRPKQSVTKAVVGKNQQSNAKGDQFNKIMGQISSIAEKQKGNFSNSQSVRPSTQNSSKPKGGILIGQKTAQPYNSTKPSLKK